MLLLVPLLLLRNKAREYSINGKVLKALTLEDLTTFGQARMKTPPRPPEVTKTGPEERFLSMLGRFGVLREVDLGALAMLFHSSGSILSQKCRTSFRLGMGESK